MQHMLHIKLQHILMHNIYIYIYMREREGGGERVTRNQFNVKRTKRFKLKKNFFKFRFKNKNIRSF